MKALWIHSAIFIPTKRSSTHFGLTWVTLVLETLVGKFIHCTVPPNIAVFCAAYGFAGKIDPDILARAIGIQKGNWGQPFIS